MSLNLFCPHCRGKRPLSEFVYGEIPRVPDALTDPADRDLDRGFMHDNLEGEVTERWFHHAGCHRWVTVERDSRTDVVVSSQA